MSQGTPQKTIQKSQLAGVSADMISEIQSKKTIVEHARVSQALVQLEEQQKEIEALENLDLSLGNKESMEILAQETGDYLLRARNAKVFLNEDFSGKIPFFARNIILLAAESGSGKSTISANLTYQAMMQGQRILVFTNEENAGDVYNRITCLIYRWFYANHEKFTDEQVEIFKKNILTLSERITVISDTYNGVTGCTTTIEGIEGICRTLIRKKIEYDLIIFDYYQNINRSAKNASLADWQVHYRFCKFLDQYKNQSNACLVVLSQKKASSKDKEVSFQESLEGRKSIYTVSTCAINVVKDVDNSCTNFEIKKSRFNACVGETIRQGFDKGRYVPYTQEFKERAMLMKAEREQAATLAAIRLQTQGDGT